MQSHLREFTVSDQSTLDKLSQLIMNLLKIKDQLESENALTAEITRKFDAAIRECHQRIISKQKSTLYPDGYVNYYETIQKCEKLLSAYTQSESAISHSSSSAAAQERKILPISTSKIKWRLSSSSKSVQTDQEKLQTILASIVSVTGDKTNLDINASVDELQIQIATRISTLTLEQQNALSGVIPGIPSMQPRAIEKMPSVDKKEQPAASTVTHATTITASTPKSESPEELVSISLWKDYSNISLNKLSQLEQELQVKRDDINRKLDIIAKVKDERTKGLVEMQAQASLSISLCS